MALDAVTTSSAPASVEALKTRLFGGADRSRCRNTDLSVSAVL